jgi:hypothetical protein
MMVSKILKERQSYGGNPSAQQLLEVKATRKASQKERLQRSHLNCFLNNVVREEMEIVNCYAT